MMDLTIEDELDLIKGRKTPAQLAAAPVAPASVAPAPVAAPAAAPAPKTPAQIDIELGLPPAQTGLGPSPDNDAGFWDVAGAAWTAETRKTDAWNYAEVQRRALTEDMWSRLSKEGQARVTAARGRNGWASMAELVTAEAGRQAAASPDVAQVWAGYPLSIEAFNQQIDAGRLADIEEAQTVLDQPGGGLAEFIGTGARAMTDETSVMLLPFGLGGGALRTILSEAALGAIGEAAVIPKEFRVAAELGLPDPDPISRIATGALLGGGLSAFLVGLGKGARALKSRAEARRASITETLPDGTTRVEHEAELDATEAKLHGDETVQERLQGDSRMQDGTLGSILADGPPPPKGTAYSGVAEAGSGYTVLVGPDGKAVRREGSRNWRNNNPGNIEYGPFAKSMGAIGTDGRFAVFPTYEDGRKAKATLLWGSKGYRGKTIAGAISRYAPDFENDTGAYTRAITKALGVAADTPMASLTPKQREVMMDAMERVEGFKPGTENGVQAAAPRKGISTPMHPDDYANGPTGPTSRGYTTEGQVTAGDDFRIDVDWEVVDASSIFRASGDMQPRDRSRIASDAWISDTAARLDPAQLMPSPTADRGTPIVGPDGMIESGNGRFGAIERAYERHPDRADAYRAQIEAAGYAIPEGVERPVLIARRRTDLSDADRRRFAISAQDSGVAAMTPTEVARASSRAMTAPVLARLEPLASLREAANGDFVRAALAALPRSARNAMFDASGMLNATGERQLREALFARAWPDPDILARFTETDAGELKSLMEALERAAPAWAALKADIEAGLVTPDMDISPFVLDAMRLIGAARDLAKKQGMPVANAMAELLDEVDLIEGAISPLTAALVRKFWVNGKAASADTVAGFLTRYADDARKAGASGSLFDAPTPRDVLVAIDRDTFADLPEDIGTPRGASQTEAPPEAVADLPGKDFNEGARSPAAEATHAEIVADLRGPAKSDFGPVYSGFTNDPAGAIAHLLREGKGEITDAFVNARSKVANVSLVYGDEAMGLRHIEAKRPHLIDRIPEIMERGEVYADPDGQPRLYVVDWGPPATFVVVRLDWNQRVKHWIVTAIDDEKGKFSDRAQWEAYRFTEDEARFPASPDPEQSIASESVAQLPDPAALAPIDFGQLAIDSPRKDLGLFADVEIDEGNGIKSSVADMLDDLDADAGIAAAIQGCAISATAGVAT